MCPYTRIASAAQYAGSASSSAQHDAGRLVSRPVFRCSLQRPSSRHPRWGGTISIARTRPTAKRLNSTRVYPPCDHSNSSALPVSTQVARRINAKDYDPWIRTRVSAKCWKRVRTSQLNPGRETRTDRVVKRKAEGDPASAFFVSIPRLRNKLRCRVSLTTTSLLPIET